MRNPFKKASKPTDTVRFVHVNNLYDTPRGRLIFCGGTALKQGDILTVTRVLPHRVLVSIMHESGRPNGAATLEIEANNPLYFTEGNGLVVSKVSDESVPNDR